MTVRYTNTERLGVIATDLVVTRDLNWIFREQPIVDVGVDAILEQVVDGQPKGKFLAVQIKTGDGNFHRTPKYLTHYVSAIHYNYWLNLNIPIILIAHIPVEDLTVWIEINEGNFKKVKKRWKLDIPLNQKFNSTSINRLSKLFTSLDINATTLDSTTETGRAIHLENSTLHLSNMSDIIWELTELTKSVTDNITDFVDKKYTNKSPQVSKVFANFSAKLRLYSWKLEEEINLFSKSYSLAVNDMDILFTKTIAANLDVREYLDVALFSSSLNNTTLIITNMETLKNEVINLSIEHPLYKEAKKQHLEVIDLIIFEMTEAKKITENLVNNFQLL
ncbi:DUF4365 domain-containing protein [Flavobacterium sp. DG1-102-2]|uniref:DUF4365 domain-containing protein n=1 Tax=Flavobacterium sp. DG1-102-2 TaxID=3081663 RepID=UPI002949D57A|nr:DUF4365 domain-containing protein [Flavobacterium sp. DG1-102-2]MDV6166910.1 DUF4365 domain-containing protein [Flavobacterium sp. DG1-102-2]